MKGHIKERSPGRFAIILEARDPATGKRKRRCHKYAGTKRQAQIECAVSSRKFRAARTCSPIRRLLPHSSTAGLSTKSRKSAHVVTSAMRSFVARTSLR